jgi:hypothetical protein
MRNILLFCIIAALATCFSLTLSAQQPKVGEEDQHQLAAYQKNTAEHAKALHDHAATQTTVDKKFATEYVQRIGESLEAAEKHLSQLEAVARLDVAKFPNEFHTMRTELENALQHYRLLKKEIDKPVPSKEKVKEHSSAIYNSAKKGHETNSAIMAKRGIAEPKEP